MLSRMASDPGWQMVLNLDPSLEQGKPATVQFSVTDKDGVPIQPDKVGFFAYRPSDAKQDFAQPMEPLGQGRYRAQVVFPLKGVWDLLVSVRQGDEEHHQGRRILVAGMP
jgi:nitrogen fixation protein FixH